MDYSTAPTWSVQQHTIASTAYSNASLPAVDRLPSPFLQESNAGLQVPQQRRPPMPSIRRARSSGALPTVGTASSSLYPSLSPLSPVSTGLPAPRGGQQLDGASWFPSAPNPYLNLPASPSRPVTPSTYRPMTANGSSYHQHQRNASAQAALTTPSSSGRYAPVGSSNFGNQEHSAASMSYSYSTPTSQRKHQQPSVEEVNQFFQDMTEILGAEAMAALSPTSLPFGSSLVRPLPPPSPKLSQPAYNVCGVLLNEGEYTQYTQSRSANSSLSRQSSPPHADLQTGPSHSHLSAQYAPSTSHYATTSLPVYAQYPPYDICRPRSAPPSPAVEGMATFVPYGSPPSAFSFDTFGSQALNRRRGSSVDAAIPRSFPPSTPAASTYSYPPHTPFRSLSPSASHIPPPYPSSYTPVSPSPAPRPMKPTPRRAGGGRKSPGVVSFINFSPSDSKVLLSGVAPSGSSKKRAREEGAAQLEKEAKKRQQA
ncbi:hypothetical protein JCM1841_002572 [Sporobolomyces salmonicolor]